MKIEILMNDVSFGIFNAEDIHIWGQVYKALMHFEGNYMVRRVRVPEEDERDVIEHT